MISIEELITKVEEEFEDLETGTLEAESNLREKFTWDSVNALIFIAHVNVEYGVVINADDLTNTTTLQSLYDIVKERADKNAS